MPLDQKQRKALLAASHRLKPAVIVSPGELSEGVIAHVLASFGDRELIKVRVAADSAAECDAVAGQIVARVGCEIVKRVGRVIVLYREKGTGVAEAVPEAEA